MKAWKDIEPGTYHFRNTKGQDLERTVIDVSERKVTYTRAEEPDKVNVADPQTFLRVWKLYGVELVER